MRQLTIERTAAAILFALLFALAARVPTDTDTWWHLRSGETMLRQGFIYTDLFSHTVNGNPWTNHSWGAQLVMLAFWNLAGNLGLTIYMAGLATGGMYLLFRASAGSVYLRAFALVLGAATAAVFWSPRPQMLSFFLSTVLIYLLFTYKRTGRDHLWWIPVLMGVWGNLHAGFSIGFILLGGMIAGEILNNILRPQGEHVVPWAGVQRLILVSLLAIPALLVNPYGLEMLKIPFQTVSIGALQNFIQEWNSPNFHERQTWPFIALLLAILGAAGGSSKRLDWTDFILVSGTAFMALLAGRNIAVFAVVATPILTYYLYPLLAERGWDVRPMRRVSPVMAWVNVGLLVLVLLGSAAKVLLVLSDKVVNDAQAMFLPVGAADYLLEHQPEGPMFNSYNWGGYLMFRVPEQPVFVDGRTDLYGDEFLTRYLKTATGGDGWAEEMDRYDIQLVVVEKGSGLAARLAASAAWTLAYEDELAVVYTRGEAA